MKKFKSTLLALLMLLVISGASQAQLLTEQFNYTPSATNGLSTQSSNLWIRFNTGDSILVTSGSLSYTGLPASVGNKVSFGGSGSENYVPFTSQTTGTVYFSFILNITSLGSLNATGGYWTGLIESGSTSVFGATIWTRLNGTGFDIGINPRTTAANTVWSTGPYSTSTSYFIVGSYQLVSGTGNDVVKLWVNPALGGSEPAATITATNTGGTDLASLARLFLRQDGASATPGNIDYDELRIGTTWAQVAPGGSTPTITLSSPTQTGNANADQGATNVVLSNFQAAITTANATLNSLAFTSAGTYAETDLQNIKLWYNGTGNTFSGASQIGSTLTTSLGTGTHTFSGLTQGINSGSTGYFWITCDISATATTGNTINAAANPVLTFASGTPTGTVDAGGTKTITEAVPDINILSNHPSGGSINQNSTDNVLYSIQLDVTKANATLTGVTVTTAGTYTVSDLQANSFKFWINSANNLTGATQLGTGQAISGPGSDITVSGLTQSVPIGTRYLLVTASVSYNANTSKNISFGTTVFDNIVFLSGVKLGSDPVNAGNSFTFAEVLPGIAITNLGPAAGTVVPPSVNAVLYKLSFAVTNNSTDFNSITLTTGGTYQTTDITANSLKLWINTVNNLGTATLIGSGSAPVSGGSITYNSLNHLINSGTTAYVWLTADIEAGAVIGRTINITSTAFTNILFSAGTKTGTDPAAEGGTQTFSALPMLTELVVPQYMGSKTASGTNNARTPVAFCLKIDNLIPGTAYDIKVQIGLTTDDAAIYGAGNLWNGTAFSGSTYTSAFVTDVNGSSGAFWVYLQPTGNATRFDAGQVHNLRVGYVTTGGTMPSAPNFVGAKTITALDIASTERTVSTADDGAFIKGHGFSGSSGKYAVIYDNITGTGNPIFSTQIRTTSYTNTSQTDLPAVISDVFAQTGTSSIGDFAAVIPIGANNPNGIRRIEVRNSDNTLYFAQTDENGNWQAHRKSGALIRRQVDSIGFYSVNVKLALQGFYDTGNNRLALGDTVTAYLAGFGSPHSFTDTAKTVIDSLDFTANFEFKNSTPSASYYIVIRHKSSIEVWSGVTVPFLNDKALFYDFTTAASTAYGNNLILVGPKYCIYSGDINQDGTLDLNDAIPILSDYDNLDYHADYDLNSDGTIDLNDAIFVLSGYDNLIGVVVPAKMLLNKSVMKPEEKKSIIERIEGMRKKGSDK